jgi:SAM-dependent MidA family methyltransferase
MIAIWFLSISATLSKPLHLVELGPGRATLMRDLLRTLTKLNAVPKNMRVHLVEVSTGLREMQKQVLGNMQTTNEYGNVPIEWHDNLSTIPKDGLYFNINF